MQTIQNYINGSFVSPSSGNYIDNIEPATGNVYAYTPDSNHTEIDLAVEAANLAFPEWSTMGVEARSSYLYQMAKQIKKRSEELIVAESKDNGKPESLARKIDIPRAHDNIHFFASAIEHFASESHFMEKKGINYTLRRPLGVVGCISPWNLPLYLFTWKIAPALAAGNCVVAKPSEITPMTAYLFSQIADEANLPPGVLNVVHGYGHTAGQAIVEHKEIKAVSFTGGTQTGQKIAQIAAPMFKKLSLELGGKNPNIIFADADIEKAVQTTVLSSFSNQGEICLCGSRVFVEQTVYAAFKEKFLHQVQQLTVGDPTERETNIGAMVSKEHLEKVEQYIVLAQEEGGNILCGGKRIHMEGRCANGYFLEPTIIEGLDFNCRVNQEEIFGPVVTLIPFDTEGNVLKMANAVQYGLSASVWTQNVSRAHRMAEQLEAGMVWVNSWLLRDLRTPFGGVKSSGIGREGGWEALRFFTDTKNVCIRY